MVECRRRPDWRRPTAGFSLFLASGNFFFRRIGRQPPQVEAVVL